MTHYTLRAGTLLTPTRIVKDAWVEVRDGRVLSVEAASPTPEAPTYDFSDSIVLPGLVDLQVNGALGYSFQAHHADHYDEILAYHQAAGTAVLLPTLITAPEESLLESLNVLGRFIRGGAATPWAPGIHLEGPFLAPEKSGAHDPKALRLPDAALANRFYDASDGALRVFTLAPELPGALEVIQALAARGVILSAGHSAATYDQIQAAVHAGLRLVTHAGNASDWPHRAPGKLGFLASEPGLVGALMALPQLTGCVILDGFHFHPALLAPLLKLKGADRLLLVSDSSTIAGCPPGDYSGGGLLVTVHPQGFATSGRGGGWLAGSTITLLDAVRRSVLLGKIKLRQAVHMATLGPARRLGIADQAGHLEPGARAHLVVLNRDLSLRKILTP